MDRDRISRLEALLARVKARTDEPRPADAPSGDVIEPELVNGTNGTAHEPYTQVEAMTEQEQTNGLSRPDSVFPPESSTLHALPPPPPGSSSPVGSNPSPASLEEAFEQYEMVQEVVEISPDAEDDAVHPSVLPPVLLDEVVEEEAAARVRANELSSEAFSDREDGYAKVATPAEEFQSQQRLVVAPSSGPISGVDESELEVLGEADLEEDLASVIDVQTDELLARNSQPELDDDYASRPARQAEEMIATILANGIEPPPENANRPVLELQEEEDEPPPSSRRPVSHEHVVASGTEPHEQELVFDDPPPLMTPPPESGRQVALPDLSDTPNAFEASFSGIRDGAAVSPVVLRGDLDDNSGVAVMVEPSAPELVATFGELIDLALSI